MKRIATLAFILSLSTPALAAAMEGMDMPGMKQEAASATGIVKKVDQAKGTVTVAHEPVKSLGWSAMVMDFGVENKALFSKLVPGNKVSFDFVQKGHRYVVTGVKGL